MREEYDFTNAKSNPYVKKLKKQVTINLDCDAIEYFKNEASNVGIPYQSLINLYLVSCAKEKKKLDFS